MNLVTGATGHIGNVLVRELLSRGEKVRVLILPQDDVSSLEGLDIERYPGDVLDYASLRKAMDGAQEVYHLAGIVTIMPGQWEKLYQINVVGTRNIIQACLDSGVHRLVYTSSIHAIATPPHGTVIDEKQPFDPTRAVGEYDKSKAMATLEVLEGVRRGLDAVIVCPTGVIGPYDYRVSEVGGAILSSLKSRVQFYLEGAYDFVDVRDVASGMILACQRGRTGESYILAGERLSMKEVLQIVGELKGELLAFIKIPLRLAHFVTHFTPWYYRTFKKKPRITPYSLYTLCSNSVISPDKAYRELGYTPRAMRQSIEDTARWFVQRYHLHPIIADDVKK